MEENMLTVKDRVAIITGSTNGIGRAIAIKLATCGLKVVVLGRNEKRARDVIDHIVSFGGTGLYLIGDINDEQFRNDVVEKTIQAYGQIDILVNCAGILTATKIEDISVEEWKKVVGTNLDSSFFLIQKCIPYLKQSDNGRIINISSNAGRMGGYENSQAYTASKGGMIAITMGIARQLAPYGVTVNVVCPGTTSSEMSDLYDDEKKKRLLDRIPLGRFVKPEEIAAAVMYFASEEAASTTGAILDINGGMYMG